MTKDARPYSRHYWELIDDDKFVEIYPDDHHYATWSRLLMYADQAWPASAPLPGNVRRASVRKLEEVGLISVFDGRYRVVGMNTEREKRSKQAKDAADTRWAEERARSSAQSNAASTATASPPDMPSKEEKRRAEQEQSTERAGDDQLPAVIRWLAQKRIAVQDGSQTHIALARLVDQHGAAEVIATMLGLPPDLKDAPQYVYGARKQLNPIPNPTPIRHAKGFNPSVEEARAAFNRERPA